jgi:hypothetical protein
LRMRRSVFDLPAFAGAPVLPPGDSLLV